MKKSLIAAAFCGIALLSSCGKGRISHSIHNEVDTVSYAIGMANAQGIDSYFAQMGIDSTAYEEFLRGVRDGALSGDDSKSRAYYLGIQAGLQLSQQMVPSMEMRMFGEDSTQHISMKNMLAGFSDGLNKKSALKMDGKVLTPDVAFTLANDRMTKISARYMAEKYGKEKKAAEDFIARKAKEAGVKHLGGNVYYKEIAAGTGEKAQDTDILEVTYTGRLAADGTVFDDSSKRNNGKPVDMNLGGIIEGMKIALKQMPVGSEWEIYIPFDKAYGAQGVGPIPPFAALIFRVKLEGIKAKEAQAPVALPVQAQ